MIRARAAVADGFGNVSIENVHLAAPSQDQVLLRIRASGVCHTDWDSLQWGRPLILGHEGAGEVLQVGHAVTNCAPGDRVLLNWAIPCGKCFQCAQGKENICEDRGAVEDGSFHREGLSVTTATETARSKGSAGPGAFNASFSLGTMATHALVPQAAVLRLPAEVPFEVGAILGCAVMTGFGSAVNAARVTPGSTVVVLGCGGVGLSVILGALYCKAGRIVAVDINQKRLDMALQFGASEIILAEQADTGLRAAAAEVRRRNGGRGADYAFECTAVPELASAPLAMVHSAGTAVGVSGIEQTVPIDMELFEWDKSYINPLYGFCRPTRDFPLMMDLYLRGQLPLDAMISRRYALDQLPEAFHDMRSGKNAKGVIVFD